MRVRSSGLAALNESTDALTHLAVDDDKQPADVTLCVWDSHGTGAPMPAYLLPAGIYVASNHGMLATVTELPRTSTVYMPRFRLGVAWLGATSVSPYYAGPLREVLAAAVRPFGWVGMHAAAVGNAQGAVLLAGASGAGKSTTALACACAGMALVAEDFCLVKCEPSPVVHSLYSGTKLSAQSASWLALPAQAYTGRQIDGKRVYLLHSIPSVKLARELPIQAVLVLRITGERHSRLRLAKPVQAINALAPTSVRLMGLPAGAAPEVFRAVASLVRLVRCYHLELGTDLEVIPSLIDSAITGETVSV